MPSFKSSVRVSTSFPGFPLLPKFYALDLKEKHKSLSFSVYDAEMSATLTRVWLYGREVVAVSACRLCLSLCEALSWRSDGFVFTVLPEAGSRFFCGFLSIIFSSVCVKRRLWDWLGNRLVIIHWDWYQVNFNSKEKKAFEHSDRPNCLDVASGFWLSCLNSDLCCLITKLIKDTFRLKVGNWTTFRPIALPVKSVAKSFYPWIAELQSGSRAS